MSHTGGVQEWFSAGDLAALCLPGLPSTKAGVLKVAAREGWDQSVCDIRGVLARKRQGRGGGMEYHINLLPLDARGQLMVGDQARVERPDRESAWLRWDRLPDGYKAEAQRRLAVIDQVEQLIQQGLGKTAAVNHIVSQSIREAKLAGGDALTLSTVHGWFARVSGVDRADRAAYLAPDYAGRTTKTECSPEAWEVYKGDYLRQSKPGHAACYARLGRVAADKGWAIPSLKTLQRRLDAEIPRPVQTLLRIGPEALNHAFPHMDRDRSSITPMQVVNLDGHTWDVRVEWPDGTISRPHALAVQDIASGKFLAIRHDMTLNHNLVRLALGDTFRDYGLAETVLMDNGRENAAQAISGGQRRLRWGKTPEVEPDGMLKTLGIKAIFAKPYWGQAKPIERGFRNFAHDIAKGPDFEGAYTGHTTKDKPENYGSRAIPLAEFEHVVRRELEFYNARTGRRGIGMNGRSFDEVFALGVARRAPKTITETQLRLCMLASKPVSMDPKTGAVKVEGHRYWSPELGAVKRQKVIVRFDPERMDLPAYVYSERGVLLAEATRVQAGNFDSVSDARGHMKRQRDYTRGQKLQAAALRGLTARDVAAQLAAPAPPEPAIKPETNVVRPAFQAPRKPADLGQVQSDHRANWGRGIRSALGGE